jgi:hypothetical protein
MISSRPPQNQRFAGEPRIADEKVSLFDLDDLPAWDDGIQAPRRLVRSGAGMEVTRIPPATEAPGSFVAVGLAQLPSATLAPVASSQVGYSTAESASLQTGFWQSPASDDTSPVGPQGGVHALFNLDVKNEAPFPTNWFTVSDRSNLTNRRVNLPLPDCKVFVSDCEDLNVINELDGFNLQPRLSIPFDGPIDVHSVNSQDVLLINLGDTVDGREHGDHVVGINQVVWDPDMNALHVRSEQLLDQHSRYALIMTNGLRGADGSPVEATEAFRSFRHSVRGEYKHELLDAIDAARGLGIPERNIVDASVFTTESTTAILEKIRDQIHRQTPAPADFLLGSKRERTVFARKDVAGIVFREQTMADPPGFTDVDLPISQLDVIPGAVGQIAFGKYFSPDYEVHPGEYIPQVATRAGTPAVQSENEIYFNLFLPSGDKPDSGWPVAILAHGGNGNKNAFPLPIVASMAAQGIATIVINNVGHGFGSLGTLTVDQPGNGSVTFPAGGRGIDQNGDHEIGSTEGLVATRPHAIILNRDGQRQTVADLMQLVRIIQVGIDVNGLGRADLDPSRIYLFGQSFGAFLGMQFLAVEPNVRAGDTTSTCGPNEEFARLSPVSRTVAGTVLAARVPPLLNSPGINQINGVQVGGPFFDDNEPMRNELAVHVRLQDGSTRDIQSPLINAVPGAIAIQEMLEHGEWAEMPGNVLAYAPHVRNDPLTGVPAKSVLFQFAKGDQSCPNPTESAVVRAGGLADVATFYRHDLAYAENPNLLKNPHGFMNNPAFGEIALGAQAQIAAFFASDGKTIIHPEPARFFEVPIQGPLPEDLSFIP